MNLHLITASAGSGKTTRLSAVLDDAIASGAARPDGIVATTFTRQAAAELIERARTRLLEHGRGLEAHQLLAARIGTVNSVCGSLVTDFAFELGLSPALRVLDEHAAELEQKRALASVVDPARAEELGGFGRVFTSDLDWHQEVRRLIEAARANDLDAEALGRCARRSIASLDACLGPCAADGDALDRALAAAIDGALAAIDVRTDPTVGTGKYVELLRTARHGLARGPLRWGDWAKLGHDKPTKKSLAAAGPVAAAAQRHLAHPRLRAELHRFITLLFAVAAAGLAAYQAHKRALGVIDFVDQEALALQLLRRPDVREALVGRFDLVLIDEFQDTSPLQLAIFLELAALAQRSVWVGDQKQAIYGFRGTDPALMDAVIESFTAATTDPELVRQVVDAVGHRSTLEILGTSYRSRPALVELTSDLFAPAFARHDIPEDRTRLAPALAVADEPAGLGPIVEHWPLCGDERANVATRAAAVAHGVRDLLASAPVVRDRGRGTARPATRADVAILCRTNEQCQAVAEALAALGLPAIVPRLGLLDTAEGRAVLAGLRLWVDPRDVLARAELARLGSFATDLDGLVEHALHRPDDALPFADEPAVHAILAQRATNPDLEPAAVVAAVIDAADLRTRAAAWGNAAQRTANLDALRAHAAAYVADALARRDAPTLVGLLAGFAEMIEVWGWQDARSDDQALVGGADAVTISTWHGAKGREWPIAILYGLETLRPASAIGLHVESDAPGFDVAAPLAGRWLRYWPNPYTVANQGGPVKDAYARSPELAAVVARADREALRLLYVGWTRARDRVVLAAEDGKLLAGLLGKLTGLCPGALTEPPTGARADVAVRWAGRPVTVRVRPVGPADPIAPVLIGGELTVGVAPVAYPAARRSPSTEPSVPCTLDAPVVLGPRLALRGAPDMTMLGNAVHAFLAVDRPDRALADRVELAADLLRRHDVAGHLAPEDVALAGSRLWTWLERDLAATRLHREWPVARRLASGTVVAGVADLVARAPAGLALVDHKTFPGALAAAVAKLPQFSGQLAAYAGAIGAATGIPVTSTWIHLPVLGVIVRVVAVEPPP